MDESQKGAASINRKEKSSFLDDDIGKDFLTSWKSMSVTKDDGMDFGFDTVPAGKKKAFNFDKLDMDFGLDGEFDKLSSFKVDMSDFDLPSPSKKVTKAKEGVFEDKPSIGKPQGKKSQFNFFDFNEMDNFDFEPSLGIIGKASIKDSEKMEISSNETEQKSSKVQVSDDSSDVAMTKDLPPSKGADTSDVEALSNGSGSLSDKENDCGKSITSEYPILSHGGRSSQENAITNSVEATEQITRLSEKAISMDKFSQHAKLDFPGPYLNGVELKRSDLSDRQTQNNCQGRGDYMIQGQKENENAKLIDASAKSESLPLRNSFPTNTTSESINSGTIKSDTDIPAQTVHYDVSAVGDLDHKENSIEDDQKNQICTAEPPSAPQCSELMVDEVTLTSHHESGGLSKKDHKGEYGERLELTGSMYRSLSTVIENDIKSNEAHAGIKPDDNHKSTARELLEGKHVLEGEKNIKHLNNISDGLSSDVLPNDCKVVGTSRLSDEEATEKRSLMSPSDKNVKHQKLTSLSETHANSDGLTSMNPKFSLSSMEFFRDAKIESIGGNKPPNVRSPKKIPDLSILKISKTKRAVKVSDSTSHTDTISQQISKNDLKVQGIAASEDALVKKSAVKKSPPNLSVKRKAIESPNLSLACLKPLKRLSSPQENRDYQEPPRQAVEEKLPNSSLACLKPLKRLSLPQGNRYNQEPPRQAVEEKLSRGEKKLNPLNSLSKASSLRDVKEPLKRVDVNESFRRTERKKAFSHETQNDSNSLSNPNSVHLPLPEPLQELYLMDIEISSTIKNDGVVEKAEAYAKELDDICNMLRKKHEEAKELLVSAVVNNNNLLMLNHPIYEEKIFKVQKFAAELMSNEF